MGRREDEWECPAESQDPNSDCCLRTHNRRSVISMDSSLAVPLMHQTTPEPSDSKSPPPNQLPVPRGSPLAGLACTGLSVCLWSHSESHRGLAGPSGPSLMLGRGWLSPQRPAQVCSHGSWVPRAAGGPGCLPGANTFESACLTTAVVPLVKASPIAQGRVSVGGSTHRPGLTRSEQWAPPPLPALPPSPTNWESSSEATAPAPR